MPAPPWLPGLLQVYPWTITTYDELYDVFRNDFVQSRPMFQGHEVWHFPEREDGREKVFWHLTSRDDDPAGERLPDLARAERLAWIRPLLEHAATPEVLAWDYSEGDGSVRTYVWLKDEDFAVVLKKYPDGRRRLVTAFCVLFPRKRRELERKHANRIK